MLLKREGSTRWCLKVVSREFACNIILDYERLHQCCYIICIRVAYQDFHNLAPDDINNLFTKHGTAYNLGDNLRLEHVCSKSKALHDFFTHRASIVWNCLPSQLSPSPVTLHSRLTLRNSLNALTKFLSARTLLQPIIIVMNLYIIDI